MKQTVQARFHQFAIGALLLAYGLTLGGLTLDGIWWDEIFTWNYSRGGFGGTLATATDVHPPLYYMVMWAWLNLTGSEHIWVMRYSSVLIGTLTLAVVYRLGWLWFRSGWVGLGAAVWLGTNSMVIYQLRDIRMYPLVILLTAVSWWMLWRTLTHKRGGTLAYALSVAALAYTYYYTVFAVLAQGIYALITHPRRLPRLIAAYLLALALFAPWLPTAYRQLQQEASITEGAAAIPIIGAVGKAYTARLTNMTVITEFLEMYTAEQISLTLGLVIFGGVIALRQSLRNGAAVLTWGVLTVALFLGINFFIPLFTPRYAIMITPGVALLVGVGLIGVAPNYRPIALTLLILGGIVAHNHTRDYLPVRDPHRAILNTIMPQLQPDDRIWYAFTFGALGSATYGEMGYYREVVYPDQLPDERFVWDASTELNDVEAVPRVWDVRYIYNDMPADIEATLTAERVLTQALRHDAYMVRLYEPIPTTPPAQFSDTFAAYPLDFARTAAAGESVNVDLLMRPLTAPTLDYSYGIHLRQNGQTVAQFDDALTYATIDVTPKALAERENILPTSAWGTWSKPRTVRSTITLPPDLPAGEYNIYFTVYHWQNPDDTPLTAPATMTTAGNLLYVGTLTVSL